MHIFFNVLQKSLRPVIGSAVSFCLNVFLIQMVALTLDPSFSLLSPRGVGNSALFVTALLQVGCFLALQPASIAKKWLSSFLFWPFHQKNFSFSFAFCAGVIAHLGVLILYTIGGALDWHWAVVSSRTQAKQLVFFGTIGAFFVAWIEEFIFRGILLHHFLHREIPLYTSMVLSSLLFALAHDLHNPLRLLTTEWQLGLGLFLLGMFLCALYHRTQSIIIPAGFHAGIVSVKVFFKKIPSITMTSSNRLWFPSDLRMSLLTHGALLIAFFIIILWNTQDKASSQ